MTTTRAAIYTRVSSDEQVEGTSLDTQRERCQAFVAGQGWSAAEVYTDEGVSGAKSSRPALNRLMADAAAGRIDVVVVLKADRFSRNLGHLFTSLDALAAHGVAFRSVTEAIETATTSGRAMTGMLGVFAQMERDLIRERTRSGVNAKVRAGGWGGGHAAPFGYRVMGEGRTAHLEVDEREATVVRQAVALVLDHRLSTLDAAKRLNALGLHPRSAPLWTSQNLRNCLRRSQWDGRWTFGKPGARSKGSVPEPIVVTIEPILSADRAAALHAHLGQTTIKRGRDGVHPLSGRLFCTCGQPMTGIARGDRANRRYRCRHGRQQPGRLSCSAPSILGDPMDDAVWAQVLALLTDPERLLAMAAERLGMLQGAATVTADAMEDAERAVARTQDALSRAAARCIALELDEATTSATVGELRQQHLAAVQHRATVAAMSTETAEAQRRMVTAQQLAQVARERLLGADRTLQAAVLALLDVRAVVTSQGDQVTVRLVGSVAHDLLLSGVQQTLAPGGQPSARALRRGWRRAADCRPGGSRRRTASSGPPGVRTP